MERIGYKRISLIIAVILILFCAWTLFMPFVYTAQAMTFAATQPTFGLYCATENRIISGSEKIDLTNSELFAKQKAVKESEYHVQGNQATEFEIPFISSAIELPQFNVTVNGQSIVGEVWYGDDASFRDIEKVENSVIEEKLNSTYSSVLDEATIGTLYTVIPDTDTITVSMKLENSCCYVYDYTNSYSCSDKSNGEKTMTLKNALFYPSLQYFFIGENSVIDFSSSCECQRQTMTFKDFIDSNYEASKGFYEELNVPIEIFYSMANNLLQKNISISFKELFMHSYEQMRFNTYKFTVPLNSDALISYSTEVELQVDNKFAPTTYMVEQKQIGNYPTNYYIALSNQTPYIIDASNPTEKSEDYYTASSTGNYYFVCSAEQKVIDTSPAEQPQPRTRNIPLIVTLLVLLVLSFIVTVVIISLIIRDRIKSKKH